MTINSFDVVLYTSIFLLPGFFIKGVIGFLYPSKRSSDGLYFLSFLAYSLINYAVWGWAYVLVAPLHDTEPTLYWFLLVVITLIGATIVAFVVGLIKQKGLLSAIFNKLHLPINTINSMPTAWDYWFSKQQPAWVIVTLVNGEKVYGLFAQKSFAASEKDGRDIYIEKVYEYEADKPWIEVENSMGIYIPKEQINYIELLK
jgi:uncharacterized membrane protein YhaH (DUF805 family)